VLPSASTRRQARLFSRAVNLATGEKYMARLARVIGLDLPHHVTQRGNGRRFILDNDTHRSIYLDLLAQSLELHGVLLVGYCLMSNHVHLVLIPRKPESMGLALKHAHGRFASYWNGAHRTSGHVWQGRYYSCPLDETHLWTALRYTELNPVRAGLVEEAQRWEWSSAAAHCASAPAEAFLAMELWLRRWCAESWRAFLGQQESDMELDEIRRSTHTGQPLGVREFVRALERSTQRRLAPEKRGRPRKTVANPQQSVLPLSFS
jgi:putative transposase